MRILVTGHKGYLGRHLVPLLESAGHVVFGLDVRDGDDVARPLAALQRARPRLDAVVHLAALCDARESVRLPLDYWSNNVGGTLGLLECLDLARFRGRFVFASTLLASRPWSSPYAMTKRVGEEMVRDLAPPGWLCLRLANLAGNHDPTPGRIFPAACRAARDGAELTLRGEVLRDYLHVLDAADAFLAALTAPEIPPSPALEVGAGRAFSLSEVVAAVEAASGERVRLRRAPAAAGDAPASASEEPTWAYRALGWRPTRSLAEIAASAWAACLDEVAPAR